MKDIWLNLSFKLKLTSLIMVLVGFIFFTAAAYTKLVKDVRTLGTDKATSVMLQGYEKELKDIVDVMAQTLVSAMGNDLDERGVHTVFSSIISRVRFFPDDSGYYFIYKKGGVVFVHGAQPDLEGKNLIDFQDPKGNFLIRKLDHVASRGGGYVQYVWEKPGQGLQPKLSYARMIPGTEYWIGTGVYIDNIHVQEKEILDTIYEVTKEFTQKLYLLLGVSWLLIVIPLSWVVIRGIVVPLNELTHIADEFSLGNLNLKIPTSSRNDEIGKLSQAIERLGASIKIAVNRLETKDRKKQ